MKGDVMEYKKRERKRRSGDELLARDRASAGKNRGARFTFFSFVAVVVSLAVVKAVNPDVPMRNYQIGRASCRERV